MRSKGFPHHHLLPTIFYHLLVMPALNADSMTRDNSGGKKWRVKD